MTQKNLQALVTRVVSRRLTESGAVYREKGLFMARGDVFSRLSVTFAEGGDMSQELLDEQWRRPTSEHRVQTWSGDTCSAVEKALIDWSNEPSGKPFPLRYDSAAAPVPEIKSLFTLVRGPLINRGWYSELPIVFEIRSPTRRESLVAEHAYWTHIGDADRAAIVAERIAEIDSVQPT